MCFGSDPVKSVPAVDTRTDRLQAAENDTGFHLGQRVNDNGKGYGTVAGFARIDEYGQRGIRKVVVRFDSNTDYSVVSPYDLRLA